MVTYLQRYIAGEHEAVWDELFTLGAAIREEPLYADALAVARETMTRARHNVELLVARLKANGYEFAYPESAYVSSPPDAAKRLDVIEDEIGELPLSLRIWHEQVGGIELMGTHPDWSQPGYFNGEGYPVYTDPLCVSPLYYVEQQVEDCAEEMVEGEFAIDIAPDLLHKANISGGGPVQIHVPNMAIDGLVSDEDYKMPFVAYLRNSFRWGGFPGFASADEQMHEMKERIAEGHSLPSSYRVSEAGETYVPIEWLAELTEGLLPI